MDEIRLAFEQRSTVRVRYTDWRGETAVRTLGPKALRFGSNQWHAKPQWLLLALDHDKGVEREFALLDMKPAPAG